MNKKDDHLIKALYKKLKIFKKEGLLISKKEVDEFFHFLIKNN